MILSLRGHILDPHSEVCHLEVLIINESILSLDEYVKQRYIDNHPEDYNQVESTDQNSQTLSSNCLTPGQLHHFFLTLDRNDKLRILSHITLQVVLVRGNHIEKTTSLIEALLLKVIFQPLS